MDSSANNKNNKLTILKQFVEFGLVGGANTLLSLVIYWLVVHFGGHYLLANGLGFIITVAISYVLNNTITFKGEGKPEWSFKTLLKVYVSYSVTGLFLASALLWIWTDCCGINENLAPIINLFFTIPINFLLNKLWAYKK